MNASFDVDQTDAWAGVARAAIDKRLEAIPAGELEDFWGIVALIYCRGPAPVPDMEALPAPDPALALAELQRIVTVDGERTLLAAA